MSNRRRTSRTSRAYRAPRPRRPPARPPRRPRYAGPGWWSLPWLPAVLAVVAETGHLAAAFIEWPESTARGAYHVVAGALLGLIAAATLFRSGRWVLAAGAAVAGTGPALWLGGMLNAAPYGELAVPAAGGVTVIEAGLAALLVTAWREAAVPAPGRTVAPRPARSGAAQW